MNKSLKNEISFSLKVQLVKSKMIFFQFTYLQQSLVRKI